MRSRFWIRTVGLRDLRESVFLVEPVCCLKERRRTEKDFADASVGRPPEERLKEQPGGSDFGPAELWMDEHLAKRALPLSDVEQRDRPDEPVVYESDPEIAGARLIVRWDGAEIGLSLSINIDSELPALEVGTKVN